MSNKVKFVLGGIFLGVMIMTSQASAVAMWCISAVGGGDAWIGSPLCRSFGSGRQDESVWWYDSETGQCEGVASMMGFQSQFINDPSWYCANQFNQALQDAISAIFNNPA